MAGRLGGLAMGDSLSRRPANTAPYCTFLVLGQAFHVQIMSFTGVSPSSVAKVRGSANDRKTGSSCRRGGNTQA